MKTVRNAFIFLLAVLLLAAACGSGSDESAVETGNDNGSSTAQGQDVTDNDTSDTNDTDNERIETLWVGPQLVDCVGAFPQECMQVRYSEDGQVEWFYDSIEGFEHVAGTSYVLKVGVSDVDDPPADASSLRYRLIEVVEETTESATAGLDGTTWTLLGFRDGDLFDPVPEGIEVTATFDGDNIGGSSGCNTYRGTFTTDGDAVTVGPLMSTMMACEPDRMDIEQRYLSILETAESAEMTFDDRLLLKPATGLMLVFIAS